MVTSSLRHLRASTAGFSWSWEGQEAAVPDRDYTGGPLPLVTMHLRGLGSRTASPSAKSPGSPRFFASPSQERSEQVILGGLNLDRGPEGLVIPDATRVAQERRSSRVDGKTSLALAASG